MANRRVYPIEQVTAEAARAAFDYDALTGKVTWKERPRSACVSEGEFKRWNTVHAGKEVGSHSRAGYLRTKFMGVEILLHRLIWLIVYGEFPEHEIDHVNGDQTDNRLSNLRAVTGSDNCRNRRIPAHNTSGVIGVAPARSKGKWIAHIMANGENIYLGTFASVEMAAVARKAAEKVAGYHRNHGRAPA